MHFQLAAYVVAVVVPGSAHAPGMHSITPLSLTAASHS